MKKSSRDRRVLVRQFKRNSFVNFKNAKIKKIGIFGDVTLEINLTHDKLWDSLIDKITPNKHEITGKEWIVEVEGLYSL